MWSEPNHHAFLCYYVFWLKRQFRFRGVKGKMKNQSHFYLYTTQYASLFPLINVRPFENAIISVSQKKKTFMARLGGRGGGSLLGIILWVQCRLHQTLNLADLGTYTHQLSGRSHVGLPTHAKKISNKWEWNQNIISFVYNEQYTWQANLSLLNLTSQLHRAKLSGRCLVSMEAE